MNNTIKDIRILADRWNMFTNQALGQIPIDGKAFLILFRDTFKLFNDYNNEELVPKSIIKLSILMEEFACYTLFSDDRYGFDPQILHSVTTLLLHEFTEGFEKCRSKYPKLKLTPNFNIEFIDVETDDFLDLKFKEDLPF